MPTCRPPLLPALAGLLAIATASCVTTTTAADRASARSSEADTITVARGTFHRRVRLSGTVESVRMAAAIVPRLAGQTAPTLAITRLVAPGSRVEVVSPLGVPSSLTAKVREFVAVVSINGSHPNLMPDLSAAVDVAVERLDGVLVLPREAAAFDAGGAWARLARRGALARQAVTTGAVSADQVVITGGLDEGAVVARRALGGS